MLDYLVTSETRKSLLKLLFKEGETGSVQKLAHMAQARYAAAYSELMAMEKFGLSSSYSDGKHVVYRANQLHPQAELLRQLLDDGRPTSDEDVDRDNVLANLKRAGAPLQAKATLQKELPLEETLAQAVALSRQNATVLRVLPLVFEKHAKSIDFVSLRNRCSYIRQKQSLGFILDLTATLSGDQSLAGVASTLHDRRIKRKTSYFSYVTGKYALELAEHNTPAVARKWNFILNMPEDSFRSMRQKFTD